ncbi:DUF4349 domain-containing protein [Nocardiopsis algeriensis]|uniref:DUF4349 domain-containing protein n=1 Tax=Nocardiopsis algeriensis TaxID=1478215 RepID=A0A841ING2_9ACTN|nr:DUF4349 domain-containing protein [Nocardiopsis algeriensis]MBB6119624.1 hypothetical protein [Nocardiopsis algeriensis]
MTISAVPPARRVAGAVFATVLAALLTASCAAPHDMAEFSGEASQETARTSEDRPAAVAPEAGGTEAGGTEAGEPGADGSAASLDAGTAASERSLVHTASMTVRVEDVEEAGEAARELVLEAGGYIAEESVSTPANGAPAASMTLRVPAGGYEEALVSLADLGDRSYLDRSVQDVTEEVADVESRIESTETALETLRGYLEEAQDVDDLLRVEEEIQTRQAELEAFQARRDALGNQTSYSTVYLELVPPQTYVEPAEEGIGFLGGLERGWQALVRVVQGVAVAAGWLLPFAAVIALPAAGALWWLRRRRAARRRAAAAPPPAAEEAGGTGASGEGPNS